MFGCFWSSFGYGQRLGQRLGQHTVKQVKRGQRMTRNDIVAR
ncbi:hypothetical protein HanPSC8_Chr09g0360191 [Helianthus annuus]|nr:hypothetical protein HanPSC8_Chr09g0360191 [Helianthus annuus]